MTTALTLLTFQNATIAAVLQNVPLRLLAVISQTTLKCDWFIFAAAASAAVIGILVEYHLYMKLSGAVALNNIFKQPHILLEFYSKSYI